MTNCPLLLPQHLRHRSAFAFFFNQDTIENVAARLLRFNPWRFLMDVVRNASAPTLESIKLTGFLINPAQSRRYCRKWGRFQASWCVYSAVWELWMWAEPRITLHCWLLPGNKIWRCCQTISLIVFWAAQTVLLPFMCSSCIRWCCWHRWLKSEVKFCFCFFVFWLFSHLFCCCVCRCCFCKPASPAKRSKLSSEGFLFPPC